MACLKLTYHPKETFEHVGKASRGENVEWVWLSVDPLAHKFPSWTPYHYVHNNPVNMTDPDGRSVICETCLEDSKWDNFRNDNLVWEYNAEKDQALLLPKQPQNTLS